MLTSETRAPEGRERAVKPDLCAPVICPFCGEDGFDLYGLKTHFNMGWCGPSEAIIEADRLSISEPALNREEADRG
jgi:hypothetical protein